MKKEIILAILDGLDEKSILKTEKELGIKLELYLEVLQTMQDGNLVRGVHFDGNGLRMKSDIKITIEGIEYQFDFKQKCISQLSRIANR